MWLTLVYIFILLLTADVTVGFNPDMYMFLGGSGPESLTLQITQLAGILECELEVTVILTDGLKAGEFLFSTKMVWHTAVVTVFLWTCSIGDTEYIAQLFGVMYVFNISNALI